jgi:hypothetical protein
MAARSKQWVYGLSLAGIAGSNHAGTRIYVLCECYVLPGRGLCDKLITRPEDSY